MPLKQNENENSTVGNTVNHDDVPIGGKKFDIPEFPDEQPKEVKKPVRPKVSKPRKPTEDNVISIKFVD